jgi:hypothetical protein
LLVGSGGFRRSHRSHKYEAEAGVSVGHDRRDVIDEKRSEYA